MNISNRIDRYVNGHTQLDLFGEQQCQTDGDKLS